MPLSGLTVLGLISFRAKMLEIKYISEINENLDWTNPPGLDVVWFPNSGSPLVSGMSRCVVVSAVSGASAVFKVFENAIQRLGDMSRPIYLGLL